MAGCTGIVSAAPGGKGRKGAFGERPRHPVSRASGRDLKWHEEDFLSGPSSRAGGKTVPVCGRACTNSLPAANAAKIWSSTRNLTRTLPAARAASSPVGSVVVGLSFQPRARQRPRSLSYLRSTRTFQPRGRQGPRLGTPGTVCRPSSRAWRQKPSSSWCFPSLLAFQPQARQRLLAYIGRSSPAPFQPQARQRLG